MPPPSIPCHSKEILLEFESFPPRTTNLKRPKFLKNQNSGLFVCFFRELPRFENLPTGLGRIREITAATFIHLVQKNLSSSDVITYSSSADLELEIVPFHQI